MPEEATLRGAGEGRAGGFQMALGTKIRAGPGWVPGRARAVEGSDARSTLQGLPRGEDGYFGDRREVGHSWGPWDEGAMMWPRKLKGEGGRDSKTNWSTASPLFLGPPTSDTPWTLPSVCRGH